MEYHALNTLRNCDTVRVVHLDVLPSSTCVRRAACAPAAGGRLLGRSATTRLVFSFPTYYSEIPPRWVPFHSPLPPWRAAAAAALAALAAFLPPPPHGHRRLPPSRPTTAERAAAACRAREARVVKLINARRLHRSAAALLCTVTGWSSESCFSGSPANCGRSLSWNSPSRVSSRCVFVCRRRRADVSPECRVFALGLEVMSRRE